MKRKYMCAMVTMFGLTLMSIVVHYITFGVSKRNDIGLTYCNITLHDEHAYVTTRSASDEETSTSTYVNSENVTEEKRRTKYGESWYVHSGTRSVNIFPKTVNKSEVDFSNYFFDAEVKEMNLVILGGVMKCGTGTLTTFLQEHPSIRAAIGLQVFFTYNFGIQWYLKRLPKCGDNEWAFSRCTGCFTNTYSLSLINYINELSGKRLKLIFIIRSPIERLISHYTQLRLGSKTEFSSFGHWMKEQLIDRTYSSALSKTKYIDFFPLWYKTFGGKNILVLEHEEFVNTPWIAMQRVEQHLGLNPFFNESSFLLQNSGKYYCYKSKGPQMKECTHNPDNKGRTHFNITEDDRSFLREFVRPYNERLFKFLNRRYNWE
ncbi:unnamed protein product [Owenia fusiformis]|uniref:Sulfotransferase domain-containing protein n=1 Tax=Owenia fusiformis TaxID=6347 RepID=A0A8S4Q5H9_OWEFU|nr:unnamed protein product [Owenia fusiformis]